MAFSIRDLEGPYSYPEASESASSSDGETPHDDYSEAPNPESSTLPQDDLPLSQDGMIEQAQGDDEESWEDGIVTRQDDSEEVDTGVDLSLEARTPEYHDCLETVDRSSASAAVDVPSSNSPDRQSGNPLKSPQKERTKALNMAKKSMHKAKRCAKEAQKPTALEAFLHTLAKVREEATAHKERKPG